MSRPPRAQPLRAAPAGPERTGRRGLRAALVGTGMGCAVTVAATGIAFSIVAIPLFLLASTEPGSGLDRDLVRKGLFQVAVPFGVVSGLAVGVAVGLWYGRGGRLPGDRSSFHDR